MRNSSYQRPRIQRRLKTASMVAPTIPCVQRFRSRTRERSERTHDDAHLEVKLGILLLQLRRVVALEVLVERKNQRRDDDRRGRRLTYPMYANVWTKDSRNTIRRMTLW